MANDIPRLSDFNIEDDILRADFYRLILNEINKPDSTGIKHTITIDEAYRQDLVSNRIYNTPNLRWIVGLITGVEDEADPLPIGETFKFPSAMYVRREMRKFIDEVQ
ncbi:hypothetical protein ACWU37_21250 (plasmid) [Photobacterium damselae subsp. damselae]